MISTKYLHTLRAAVRRPHFVVSISIPMSSPVRKMGSTVTAQMVKDLRERSGAPMMDCKKALAAPEVEGSIDKAMDWLRAKGMAKARSNADRPASEGLIALVLRDKIATLVEVNSETDFVARNTDFQSLVQRLAITANQNFAAGAVSVEALLEAPASGGTRILREFLTDAVTKIRENIVVRRVENLNIGNNSCFGGYVHGKVAETVEQQGQIQMGKSAALLELSFKTSLSSADNHNTAVQTARKLAMHVVAAKPQYLDVNEVPQSVVDRETQIFKELSEKESAGKNKAPDILEKMIKGKVNKRIAELCLLGQHHMAEESAPIVQKFLADFSKKLGTEVKIVRFSNWMLGQHDNSSS